MFLYFATYPGDDTPIIDSPVVEVNEEDGVDLCLSFWYSMYGRYIGGLEGYTYNATNGTVKVFSARGPQTGSRGWLHGLVDIRDVTSDMRLYFQGISSEYLDEYTDDPVHAIVAIDDINLQTGVCERDTSFNCNFEEGSLCGWVKPPTGSDDTDWLLQRGATYTASTGPIVDHTTGTIEGSYLYIEASWLSTGDIAILESPMVTPLVNENFNLTFWYNMYGIDTGELNVLKLPGNEIIVGWVGQQTDRPMWLKAEVLLMNQTSSFGIRIQAHCGNVASNIAIDDVAITTNIGDLPLVPTTDQMTTTEAMEELSTSEQMTDVATTSALVQQTSTGATLELTSTGGTAAQISTTVQESGIATTGALVNQTSTGGTLELSTNTHVAGMATTDDRIDETAATEATPGLSTPTTTNGEDGVDGGIATTDTMIDQTSVTEAASELSTVERVTSVMSTDNSIVQTSTAANGGDGGDGGIATTDAMNDQTSTADGGNGGDDGESSTSPSMAVTEVVT
ncbi:MAM and LDL-receptor class A domain-containing protein 2-like [Patiria miniata]|uniref:MAM domain-containing protein n=1 Tax=Patiria miniata TaxID=46514 RepID=A0A913ZLT8_PATMI|nr:MAM and LDL-receptor class A domain-containing protein 2-like [Patiria miniata]